MTYPLAIHLGTHVRDYGDTLLNTWIISWNIHKISALDFGAYFDANIFFPHPRTLAYSEFLLSQSLIALPIKLVSGNPVLAHNFVLLLAVLTSGLGMYALARYLTKNRMAGVVSGLIFAFSPFMFAHLFHIQVLTAGGIPLALLFLHRFFDRENIKDLFLFGGVFVLQSLGNGYYALFLTLFAGISFLYLAFVRKKIADRGFLLKIALLGIAVSLLLFPFFFQYQKVWEEMGFVRESVNHARLTSYLATAPINRIYGNLTESFRAPEGELFPGVIPFFLAIGGAAVLLAKRKKLAEEAEKDKSYVSADRETILLYALIGVLAFLCTFGLKGPYRLLYTYVPGFGGLRAITRIHVFSMLFLSLMAGFGVRELMFLRKKWLRFGGTIILPLLILIEYLSFPVPLQPVNVKKDIPEVYRWLSGLEGEKVAVLGLPFPPPGWRLGRFEGLRMYYSTYHWHHLVNGYSGHIPPLYTELRGRWRRMPIEQNIKDLEVLGVKYIICHDPVCLDEDLNGIQSGMEKFKEKVRLVGSFGDAFVYELMCEPSELEAGRIFLPESINLVPRSKWKATSSVNPELAAAAFDNDISTRWYTGIQTKGDFYEVDLGSQRHIRGIRLKMGKSPHDYPRGYLVEVSRDGVQWFEVAREEMTVLPITAFLKPNDIALDIHFSSEVESRYLRITNIGEDDEFVWSVYEIEIYEERYSVTGTFRRKVPVTH